eukprot:TRINITY_DN263_c0_g2_i1.p1 TRINITY_DN263_c0_g2~~TRINITY_DN263_c0_g2_i1.p1  ORF type:complete len:145 (+),score=47.69 TRINITY_DN263_c0_g2_i1:50-484(+)
MSTPLKTAIAKAAKQSTGIVGIPVVPNAREVLINMYTHTLQIVKAIPAQADYRKAVEEFTTHRLEVVKSTEDIAEIESKINCGQVEELIEQAKDELELIPVMLQWKPWDKNIKLPIMKPIKALQPAKDAAAADGAAQASPVDKK